MSIAVQKLNSVVRLLSVTYLSSRAFHSIVSADCPMELDDREPCLGRPPSASAMEGRVPPATSREAPSPMSSSPPSTPLSYHTAVTASGGPNDTITDYNSPPPPTEQPCKNSRRLPDEPRRRLRVYLEEKSYPEAVTSLRAFLASELPNPARRVCIPNPAQLAFVGNLTIHPAFTNKITDPLWHGVAQQSLDYLYGLLDAAGPLNTPFGKAFRFRRLARRKRSADSDYEEAFDSDREDDAELIRKNPMATTSSIWARGHDFWSAVGWALVCSSSSPARWPYWRDWLAFMLEMLERDWIARMDADEAAAGSDECPTYQTLQQSIFASYLDTDHVRLHGGAKFALDAILAGLAPGSASKFEALFHKETAELDERNRKRKYSEMRVDVEKQMYGGYVDDDDDEDSSGPPSPTPAAKHTRSGRRTGGRAPVPQNSLPITDGVRESIPLRIRLVNLVTAALRFLPSNRETGLDFKEFHEKLAGHIKKFNFPVLEQFLDPLCDSQEHLASIMLDSMLLGNPEKRYAADKKSAEQGVISQPILEQYLPLAAIAEDAGENARLSLILETLIQTLWQKDRLAYSERLQQVVDKGIAARGTKAGGKARKKKDAEGMARLAESGDRLQCLLEALKASQ